MNPDTQQPINTTIVNNNDSKKVGPVIAILVIVLILIVAALYLFASRGSVNPDYTNQETGSMTNPEDQSVQPVTNNSDDTTSLENDLNASTNGLENQNF